MPLALVPESGPGKGTTADGIGLGAGHGGSGGAPEPTEGGTAYGSLYTPSHSGSGGGNGGGTGGAGGGVLHWINGNKFQLDGFIYLAGADGEGGNAGGGSGGSILIETIDFDGHGEINTQGGNAAGQGFGGSGGRIAIHAGKSFLFPGNFQNAGGRNMDGNFGAAGTVYVEETERGPQYADIKYNKFGNLTFEVAGHRYIEIDNENQDAPWIFTMLSEGNVTEWEVDEAHVTRYANVRFYHPPSEERITVVIHKFVGDRTGLVHIRFNQTIYVEYIESQNNETIAPCSFRVDEDGEIVFPATVAIRGIRSWFGGLITGVHHLSISEGGFVTFLSTGHTSILENLQNVYTTAKGNYSFASLTVERDSEGDFIKINNSLGLFINDFRVKYKGMLSMNIANIESSNVWIESQGVFHLDGRGHLEESGPGSGETVLDVGTGGGHGGQGGGPSPNYGGTSYDSVFSPFSTGSGGGSGTGQGGIGGGYLRWHVAEEISVDGELALRGMNGLSGNAGGGSGGGLMIKTTNMSGHGVIDVRGGNGTELGGGGAGGRVGIHCRWHYQFGGEFIHHGGLGDMEPLHGGAAGTIYVEENLRPLEYRILKRDKVHNNTFLDVDHKFLLVNNNGQNVPASTFIQEEGVIEYFFNELDLEGAAKLLLYHPSNETEVSLTVSLFVGDRSGLLSLKANQTAFIEVLETEQSVTIAPCNYIIDAGAILVLPTEFHIHGTYTVIKGVIAGVHHLYIENQSDMTFHSTAATALWIQRNLANMTSPGSFSFSTITIKQGGKLTFPQDNLTHLECNEMRIKYGGEVYATRIIIYSSFAWIEASGLLSLAGRGYDPQDGPGAGYTINEIGYGAAFGGEGGGVDANMASQPYGSMFKPVLPGSGGGNADGTGGKGGGQFHWQIGQYLELNGLVTLEGLYGTSGNAGGGSGGSVLIETTNMTGHGEIKTLGGNGGGQGGCGGSGGRIAIHCRWSYTYVGSLLSFGGRGGSSYANDRGAAAGTIYIEENMRPLRYRRSKYIQSLNETLLVADHTYLKVDNNGYIVPVLTYIFEEGTINYEFDEIELSGYSKLGLYKPHNETMATLTVHQFIGDKTGQFHLSKNQTAHIEVLESDTSSTESPCTYVIEYGAEIIFPSEVHLYGTQFFLNGLMTGVHDLYIENVATMTVTSTVQTALLEEQQHVHVSQEGNFSVPRLYVKQDGNIDFTLVSDDILIDATFLEIKYEGLMQMNHGFILSDEADIESDGVLNLDGGGHGGEMGKGAGTTAGSYGTGASHGGVGGSETGTDPASTYGSVFNPSDLGSGGGNDGGQGGSGGGALRWDVGRVIHINGLISASGTSGTSNSGGGSGGSIVIQATNMTGHGEIRASGGDGAGYGGGGAGGRIAVRIDYQNNFGGQYTARGGSYTKTSSLDHMGNGAGGTVYKFESRRGPQYRDYKYLDIGHNVTKIKPEHSKLTVDNGLIDVCHPVVIMEEDLWFYEFDEVQVEGYSCVHFYLSDSIRNVTAVIHELTGDKKGLIRVQRRQRLFVNIVESTHTYLDAPCGFLVDWGGDLVLPTTVIIRAENVVIEGQLSGVQDLTVERDGQIEFSGRAFSSLLPPSSEWYIDEAYDTSNTGAIFFASLAVNNQGALLFSSTTGEPSVDTGLLIVRKGGSLTIECEKINMNSTDVIVECGAAVTADGSGFTSGEGPGAGSGSTGGSHASHGKRYRHVTLIHVLTFNGGG